MMIRTGTVSIQKSISIAKFLWQCSSDVKTATPPNFSPRLHLLLLLLNLIIQTPSHKTKSPWMHQSGLNPPPHFQISILNLIRSYMTSPLGGEGRYVTQRWCMAAQWSRRKEDDSGSGGAKRRQGGGVAGREIREKRGEMK